MLQDGDQDKRGLPRCVAFGAALASIQDTTGRLLDDSFLCSAAKRSVFAALAIVEESADSSDWITSDDKSCPQDYIRVDGNDLRCW